MSTSLRSILFCLRGVSLLCLMALPVCAKPPSLIELKTEDQVFTGKSLVHNDDVSWMVDRAGSLSEVPLNKVTAFRRVASEFKKLSLNKLKSQLQDEFGPQFEVTTTRHYVVCAPRGKARAYATVFEDLYKSFSHYFALRGYQVKTPEFMMVAVVFPDQKRFFEYCRKDGVRASQGLLGYYHPYTNRTALFDQSTAPTVGEVDSPQGAQQIAWSRISPSGKDLTEALRDTMIHEATHQLAFNTGLHSRIGDNPRWVVEGLATAFESDELRSHTGGSADSASRINRDRLIWFMNYSHNRRKKDSLRSFVREGQLFKSATLDAYAESWALTFFLVETQPARYSRYLKQIASRDPLKPYTADEREQDFQKAFKTNFSTLETDYLKFMDQLAQNLVQQSQP